METDTQTFTRRIRTIQPSNYEFWPKGGWYAVAVNAYARIYACRDKAVIRRAIVRLIRGRWRFEVREHVAGATHGTLLAQQPMQLASSNIVISWRGADRAATRREVSVSASKSGSVNKCQ